VRAGTAAERLPGHVEHSVKHARAERLIALPEELALAFHRRLVGTVQEVLVERSSGPWRKGLTDTYVRVEFQDEPGNSPVQEGDLVSVRVDEAESDGVTGRLVDEVFPALRGTL